MGYHSLYATDGSEGMLAEARKKNIYKSLQKVWLGKDNFDAPDSELKSDSVFECR